MQQGLRLEHHNFPGHQLHHHQNWLNGDDDDNDDDDGDDDDDNDDQPGARRPWPAAPHTCSPQGG